MERLKSGGIDYNKPINNKLNIFLLISKNSHILPHPSTIPIFRSFCIAKMKNISTFHTFTKVRIKNINGLLIILGLSLLVDKASAAHMIVDDFYVRDYLDFGQNKGVFKPGATNITLTEKNGTTFTFPDVPFPDFSAVQNKGDTTSIGGAYSVTAAHVKSTHQSIKNQVWGASTYTLATNGWATSADFAVTRLTKFVVETTGLEGEDISKLTNDQMKAKFGIDYNGSEQVIGFRAGDGSIELEKGGTTISQGGTTTVGGAYENHMLNGNFVLINSNTGTYIRSDNYFTDFGNRTTGGDSGSSILLYDKEKQEWVIVGTLNGEAYSNAWNHARSQWNQWNQDTVNSFEQSYTQSVALDNKNETLTIDSSNSNMTLSEDSTTNNSKTIVKDKDMSFTGGGNVTLSGNLDLGVGGLIFDEGNNYTIDGKSYSYKGAGIDIGAGSVVNWDVQGVSGDNLHKIGEGTLDVKVAQKGNLKVGNGNIILDAANSFGNIYIVNGLADVKLNVDNAIDLNKVYFAERGGTLDLNGHSLSATQINATDSGANIINNNATASNITINNTTNYAYHGQFNGNINITHSNTTQPTSTAATDITDRLILDGGANINGNITISNSALSMQGHAVDHAMFREGGVPCSGWAGVFQTCDPDYVSAINTVDKADATAQNKSYMVSNVVNDFKQPDWDTRTYKFTKLTLTNSNYEISRNANVIGDINATNSTLTFGNGSQVYLDTWDGININNNGFGFRQALRNQTLDNTSANGGDSSSSYIGNIDLTNSTLTINNTFNGNITARNNSNITINSGGTLNTQNYLYTQKEASGSNQFTNGAIIMNANSTLNVNAGAQIQGDINASSNAVTISFGTQSSPNVISTRAAIPNIISTRAAIPSTPNNSPISYRGAITASQATANFNNVNWDMTGDSTLDTLNITDSGFNTQSSDKNFSLNVSSLTANNSSFVIRTNLKSSDVIKVTNSLSGSNNTLDIDFLNTDFKNISPTGVTLIEAPNNSSKDVFKAGSKEEGFSIVTPTVEVRDNANGSENAKETEWVLTGVAAAPNTAVSNEAKGFSNLEYRNFMIEVNHSHLRLNELEDSKNDAGIWANVIYGGDSIKDSFSGNFMQAYAGVDKKFGIDGASLFFGAFINYTNSTAQAPSFSGNTNSIGGGLYFLALLDSGFYVDLVGKYSYYNNVYSGSFAGFGTNSYANSSSLGDVEIGYNYKMIYDMFLKPQFELVYGGVWRNTLSWRYAGTDAATIDNKNFTPLIGRIGLDFGKTFSGDSWNITALVGLGYQFDMLPSGDVVLEDEFSTQTIKGKRDNRMLFNVGINSQIKDSIRLSLEFQNSILGYYNTDYAINANLHYLF